MVPVDTRGRRSPNSCSTSSSFKGTSSDSDGSGRTDLATGVPRRNLHPRRCYWDPSRVGRRAVSRDTKEGPCPKGFLPCRYTPARRPSVVSFSPVSVVPERHLLCSGPLGVLPPPPTSALPPRTSAPMSAPKVVLSVQGPTVASRVLVL